MSRHTGIASLPLHTGKAPPWGEFFARWKAKVARGEMGVRPYRPRPIPPFRPVKIRNQEVVQETDDER